jgi:hypothetical protein
VGNKANVNIQVNNGDVNVVAPQGNLNMKAENMNIDITKDFRVKAQSVNFQVSGSWLEAVDGTNRKTGSRIDLN